MLTSINDTISAIATTIGTASVSIVRLSGENSIRIVSEMFSSSSGLKKLPDFQANRLYHGFIFDEKSVLDEAVVLVFKAPHSYTGEDVAEIQCHGGVSVTKAIFDLTLKHGARIAEKGEFTKRAFLNHKIDLSQAEAVLDIISAKTEKFARLSTTNLCGKFAIKIRDIRIRVLDLLTKITASIDFPEEVEELDYSYISEVIQGVVQEINSILCTAETSNILREGAKIAIAGKPNVGKSSLFNTLLSFERAIVTDIAGTTRDVIQETIDINGIACVLLDTAGIRNLDETKIENKVETIGINYSVQSIEQADLVLFLTDLSTEATQEDFDIFELVKDKNHIITGTKSDLPCLNTYFKGVHTISNVTKNGIEELTTLIENALNMQDLNNDSEFLTNSRQQESLKNCKDSLLNALKSTDDYTMQDFIAIDIKSALISLGEITGDDITQEVLNNIFENFCIGK
ncbi:MAG: tRNA uridine-5-carboxymethylaminomethyl(34) synthesis GTPase MnmE [Candidatus Gastranaerophilales bacterium]|nr:tRNA uridine-5-carboxymethylaminomethyl(34) synthesis GTPase MnmE [Candidatus Gastranaerophilales bacterium]